MPTKDFRADLQEAAAPRRYNRLSQIKPGDYEGSISFNFHQPGLETEVKFDVVVSDVSDYPTTHSFVVFATSDNVVPSATEAIERAQNQGLFTGISINDVLNIIDRVMCNALENNKSQSLSMLEDENDFDNGDESMDDYEGIFDDELTGGSFCPHSQPPKEFRQKLRTDLRSIKAAGFKFGCIGETEGPIIVAISRRISELGISEEAMQAWNLLSSEYLVLLIRYPKAYQNMQDIFNMGDSAAKFIEMRVGLCTSYKPPPRTAVTAFQTPAQPLGAEARATDVLVNDPMIDFRTPFIGLPLKRLLNERLLGILKIRKRFGISWTGAELLFQAGQGKHLSAKDAADPKFNVPDSWVSPPPSILTSDHFAETGLDMTKTSFLLIAWQFTLRHFVKCTEFCLVCHCKTFDEFEALKPYVCSKELCLYQYITYGMGPALEYEIQSQPLVVDFLISLTYSRALSRRLEDFPSGLGIQVPSVMNEDIEHSQLRSNQSIRTIESWQPSLLDSGWLHIPSMTLSCCHDPKVSIGNWIVIIDVDHKDSAGHCNMFHCQVENIGESLKQISLSRPITLSRQSQPYDNLPARREVNYVRYDQNFDDLTPPNKQRVITILLDTLPDVESMKEYLGPVGSQKLLSSWRGRIIPAALDILRWIVASNRSSILQDNEDPNHLVAGMRGYVQFRLVQGAPDKEQRFIKAMKSVSLPVNPSHPTIFAWHGSPVYNWHSILREGLHFKQVSNGRASGNGVYMSSYFKTSMGYSGEQSIATTVRCWPHSKLDLRCVVSLNEVVNKTDEFVSCNPHFVVQNLEWIQPRYLFVGTSDSLGSNPYAIEVPGHISVYDQDPKYPAYGPNGKTVSIPLSAVSSHRRRMTATTSFTNSQRMPSSKKQRLLSPRNPTDTSISSRQSEDCASVSTATEDLNILCSESETCYRANADNLTEDSRKRSSVTNPASVTHFVPGTLTEDSLPRLAPPRYATTPATKLLQQHLQTTLKIQSREPPTDLGWYVDPNLITTVYQWIVELHTFDSSLPLAKDLKAVNLQSIILELRFPPQFPMSPPFVRVVRPRFLEFAAGGGGHVTTGGAMCMELLTNSGWSPVASIESVLLQVRMAISTTEPRPGRLAKGSHQKDYSVNEAVTAFKRACLNHGWDIPSDMELILW